MPLAVIPERGVVVRIFMEKIIAFAVYKTFRSLVAEEVRDKHADVHVVRGRYLFSLKV